SFWRSHFEHHIVRELAAIVEIELLVKAMIGLRVNYQTAVASLRGKKHGVVDSRAAQERQGQFERYAHVAQDADVQFGSNQKNHKRKNRRKDYQKSHTQAVL